MGASLTRLAHEFLISVIASVTLTVTPEDPEATVHECDARTLHPVLASTGTVPSLTLARHETSAGKQMKECEIENGG